MTFPPEDKLGIVIMDGSCPVMIMACYHWMNSFISCSIPAVGWIFPLLVVSVENDLKSLSNLVHVLSMDYSKSSSNTSAGIISAFVRP